MGGLRPIAGCVPPRAGVALPPRLRRPCERRCCGGRTLRFFQGSRRRNCKTASISVKTYLAQRKVVSKTCGAHLPHLL